MSVILCLPLLIRPTLGSAQNSIQIGVLSLVGVVFLLATAPDRVLASAIGVMFGVIVPLVMPAVQTLPLPVRFGTGLLIAMTFCSFVRSTHQLLRTSTELSFKNEDLVRELRRTNGALEAQLKVDPLTNVANRIGFDEAMSASGPIALLYVDVDHFKHINDSRGHGVGDELLTQIAAVLSNSVRAGDIVARLGGDEFVVLLHCADEATTRRIARRISESVGENLASYSATVSIGGAVGDAQIEGGEVLLSRADANLYAAKQNGRNCFLLDSVS